MSNLLSDVRSILKTTPARWTDLAQTLPVELLTARPAPEEWSVLECLQHMIAIEPTIRIRLQVFLEGGDFPSINPNKAGAQHAAAVDPSALAAEFSRQRLESLRALEEVDELDFDRTAFHKELGQVTLRQMLNQWAAHDLNHTLQAERAVMQPFIHACGPWQVFFAAQVISG